MQSVQTLELAGRKARQMEENFVVLDDASGTWPVFTTLVPSLANNFGPMLMDKVCCMSHLCNVP